MSILVSSPTNRLALISSRPFRVSTTISRNNNCSPLISPCSFLSSRSPSLKLYAPSHFSLSSSLRLTMKWGNRSFLLRQQEETFVGVEIEIGNAGDPFRIKPEEEQIVCTFSIRRDDLYQFCDAIKDNWKVSIHRKLRDSRTWLGAAGIKYRVSYSEGEKVTKITSNLQFFCFNHSIFSILHC